MATTNNVDPWKALLHMSTKLTVEDPPTEEAPIQFDPANLEFLHKALLGEHNGIEEGPNMIQRFFNYKDMDPTMLVKEPALAAAAKDLADQLEDYLIMGNFAQQFADEGGFQAMINLTATENKEIQLLYLRLIPLIAENRPEYQILMAESKLMDHLIQLIGTESLNKSTKQAAISAISSCIRSCSDAWDKFFEKNGLDVVRRVLKNDKEEYMVVAKAARFVLSCHDTLVDPTAAALKNRNELEGALLLAYVMLLSRTPEKAENEMEFAADTRNEIVAKLCTLAGPMKTEDAMELHTFMCNKNRSSPVTKKNIQEEDEKKAKGKKNKVLPKDQPEDEGVQDPVATHFKIPVKYTAEELGEILKKELVIGDQKDQKTSSSEKSSEKSSSSTGGSTKELLSRDGSLDTESGSSGTKDDKKKKNLKKKK